MINEKIVQQQPSTEQQSSGEKAVKMYPKSPKRPFSQSKVDWPAGKRNTKLDANYHSEEHMADRG